MRAFAIFVALLAGALLVAANLAYPAWLLVSTLADEPIHRIMHRIAMLAALIGLVFLWRHYGLANKPSLGFDLRRAQFLRQLLLGIAIGVGIILPLIVVLLVLDVRQPRADVGILLIAKLAAGGLLSGLAIALIEETFFRGALFTAVRRESGTVLAVVLPSLLYASLHFLGGRLNLPADEIQWSSGFAVLGKMFLKYTEPMAIVDSFLALFCVGVVLAMARIRTGAIAVSMGMHAAWVSTIVVTRGISTVAAESSTAWLVGSYDGVLGWGALAYIAVLGAGYLVAARGLRLEA